MKTTNASVVAPLSSTEEITKYNWCDRVLYKIHLDLHTPDWDPKILSEIDPKKIIASMARTGCKLVYFFSKDCYGNAYYNTSIGRKHLCIGKRDLLAEIIEEAKRHDMLTIAYHSIIWDNYAAEQHPEWRMLYADGKPASDTVTTDGEGRWSYLCSNSGYLDYLNSMLTEIVQNYDVAGFHLDMLNMDFGKLSCFCENCQRKFRERTGKDLPREPTWDPDWRDFLQFRYDTVENLGLSMRRTIHQHAPGLPVVMNYHGSPGFDWRTGQLPVRHSLYSDMGTGETYTPLFGDMYPGMETRYVRNIVPGRPFEMVPWRMNRITDYTIKPVEQLRWEVFTALAGGAKIMLIDQPFHTGEVDSNAYDLMADVFGEIESKQTLFAGSPVRQVGIYFSAKNRDYYGKSQQERFIQPIQGAYKAFVECHLGVDFIFDETVTAEILKQYSVVMLADVAVMNPAEVQLFRDYVSRGGTLIASNNTSLFDEIGERLPQFQLSDVFGVEYVETIDCDTHYVRRLGDIFGKDIRPDYFILGRGSANKVNATTAQPHGDLHTAFHKRRIPEQFFSHNMHPPDKRAADAVFINRFGEGTAIYFAASPDLAYADIHELPEHRFMLRNAVLQSLPTPMVEVLNAPLNVEVMINVTQDMLYVHLLAFNPLRHAVVLPSLNLPIVPSSRMEEPMLYEARLRIHVEYAGIEVWNSESRMDVVNGEIRLVCNDVHEVLQIKLR